MKKVGKCSDLYTSRGPVLHRIITKKIKTAVDVSVRRRKYLETVSATSCFPWIGTNRQDTAEIAKPQNMTLVR